MNVSGPKAKASDDASAVKEEFPQPQGTSDHADVDVALLEDSLAKTPWERMQANDDALRFMDSLREAMQKRQAKRNAKP